MKKTITYDLYVQITSDQLDSLEHLKNTEYSFPEHCLYCLKKINLTLIKLGSAADEWFEFNNQVWAWLAAFLKFLKPSVRFRLRPEHFTPLRGERNILLYSECPYCKKELPLMVHLS